VIARKAHHDDTGQARKLRLWARIDLARGQMSMWQSCCCRVAQMGAKGESLSLTTAPKQRGLVPSLRLLPGLSS